jgi:hypothetical protein
MIIKIKENKFGLLLSQMLIKEDVTKYPVFGKGANMVDYKTFINTLSKIQNLHSDRYKDYELEEAWNDWKQTGYNKNSQEYFIYTSKFKNFMFGMGGFLRNISYVIDRLSGPLHSQILDPKWVMALNGKPDWKYSNLNSSEGSEDWQCFYTTILKLYQNPAIWNDFFFNPIFKEYAQKFFKIRDKLSDLFKEDQISYKTNYSPLLPTKEYAELNKFVGVIDKIYDKARKNVIGWEIRNRANQKEDLFYNQETNSINNIEVNDDDDF